MMISRRTFPPGGWFWFEPRTNWPGPDSKACQSFFSGMTFDQAVLAIIQHRMANPRFATAWRTDVAGVGDELDEFTSMRLAGDPHFCVSAGDAKKFNSLPLPPRPVGRLASAAGAVRKMASGVAVLVDWLGSGAKPVAPELAEKRAEVCATCPQNQEGGLERWFTIPASEMIRQQIAMKNEMKLATKWDAKMGVCNACKCPLKTKPWCPLDYILAHLTPEVKAALDPRCWMLTEKP